MTLYWKWSYRKINVNHPLPVSIRVSDLFLNKYISLGFSRLILTGINDYSCEFSYTFHVNSVFLEYYLMASGGIEAESCAKVVGVRV